jgi:hypothetical protein
MAPRRKESSSWERRDRNAEIAWKWLLRILGAFAFMYVLLAKGGTVPVATYVIIGGFVGLPNVFSWQRALNQREKDQ